MTTRQVKKIESLTPEQDIARQAAFDRAMRYGTCTDPADRPRAEAAFKAMYARLGEPEPRIVWCDGPATACLLLSAQKWDSLGASLGDSLWASLGASLRDSLGASLRDSLWDSLGASLWDSIWASLWASLRDSLRASLWDSLNGQHELNWIAYYRFCGSLREGIYSAKDADALSWWNDIGESCGWWWPRKGVVIACERPTVCHIDENRVLHCDEGPAMAFRDGWKVWAIHGHRIDEKIGERIVVRPETLTVSDIDAIENLETRRIATERFGAIRYLRESGAKAIDSRRNDIDTQRETLYGLKDGSKRMMVRDPSTGREYALGVPAEIETCEAAQGWLSHGLSRRAIGRS